MILSLRAVCLFALLLTIQACSSDVISPASHAGTWYGERTSKGGGSLAVLALNSNGTFSAEAFPIALACPAVQKNGHIAGSGTWKLEAEIRRIDLTFTALSNTSCAAPYLANVFLERGLRGRFIVAYPDGVDSIQTAIRFKRKN